jgi:hypothetical protein
MSVTLNSSDFSTVLYDGFDGGSLDRSSWRSVYSGEYHNDAFFWDPGQISVGGGLLTIDTEQSGGGWLSGGLSTIPSGQTYGRYEFRARMDEGQGTAGVILLWPSDGRWTDEVDIIETHRGDRSSFAFSNHGSPITTEYVNVDVSDWHTYQLDWVPGLLRLSVDGQVKSEITTDVPDQQMSFGIQGQVMAASDTWFGGAPDGSTPRSVALEVDFVHISSWNGSYGAGGGASSGTTNSGTTTSGSGTPAWWETAEEEDAAEESGTPWWEASADEKEEESSDDWSGGNWWDNAWNDDRSGWGGWQDNEWWWA